MDNKDLYSILGVSKGASDAEIKSAYRNLAKQYHPDKFSNASESEKKNAEEKMKDVNHAYSVLSDKEKRANCKSCLRVCSLIFMQRLFAAALPFKIKMARETGLEPATSTVTGWHSNQLSYSPAKMR